MATQLTRRSFIAGSAATIALAGGSALALDRTHRPFSSGEIAHPRAMPLPIAVPEGTGSPALPELLVTATPTGLSVPSAGISAGRYAVTFDNQTEAELWAAFMRLPDGSTVDDLNDALAAALTEQAPPPAWYFAATAPGGLSARPGQTVRFVVDLPPGEYAVHPDAPVEGVGAIPLSVTGELPADLPAIDADVTISMDEMAFRIDGSLRSGTQVVAVTNTGSQSHLVSISSVPDGTTIEHWEATVEGLMQGPGATPVEGALAFSDLVPVAATSPQSSGTTMWATLDLEPATLLLLCSVFDTETGAPHAAMGMAEIVVIEA